jgi:hypothetical protein
MPGKKDWANITAIVRLLQVLLRFFNPNKPVKTIKPDGAVGWRQRWDENSTSPEEPTNRLMEGVHRDPDIATPEKKDLTVNARGVNVLPKGQNGNGFFEMTNINQSRLEFHVQTAKLLFLAGAILTLFFSILGTSILDTETLTFLETLLQWLVDWLQKAHSLLLSAYQTSLTAYLAI